MNLRQGNLKRPPFIRAFDAGNPLPGRDRTTGVTTLLTITAAGIQSDDNRTGPTLSADGCFVAFNSVATNLVPDDGHSYQDVFVAYGPAAVSADRFETRETSRFSLTVP